MLLELPRRLDDLAQVRDYAKTWSESDDVRYELPDNLSREEIASYFSTLMPLLPDDFANSVLADLAEHPNTDPSWLENLFELGDTGCKVGICLRADLSRELLDRCLRETSTDLLEHVVFNDAVTISECEELLKTTEGKQVRSVIERAIEQK